MRTQAHFFLKNYDEAHAAYSKALALAPNDELIAQALADVAAEQTRQLRRARLQKMISDIQTQQLCPQVITLIWTGRAQVVLSPHQHSRIASGARVLARVQVYLNDHGLMDDDVLEVNLGQSC